MEKTFSHLFHIHLQCLSFSSTLIFFSLSFSLIRNEDFSLPLISEDFHLNIFHLLLLVLVNVRNLFCSLASLCFHSRVKYFVYMYAVMWYFFIRSMKLRMLCNCIAHKHFFYKYLSEFSSLSHTKKICKFNQFSVSYSNCKLRY